MNPTPPVIQSVNPYTGMMQSPAGGAIPQLFTRVGVNRQGALTDRRNPRLSQSQTADALQRAARRALYGG